MKAYSVSLELPFLPTLVQNIEGFLTSEQHLKNAVFLLPTQGSRLDFQKLYVQKYGIKPKVFVLNETLEDDLPAHFIFCTVFKSLYEELEKTPLDCLRTSLQAMVSLTKFFLIAMNEITAHQVKPNKISSDDILTRAYFDIFCKLYKTVEKLKEERIYEFSAEKRIRRIEKLKRYLKFLPHTQPIVIAGVVATKPYIQSLFQSLMNRDHVHLVVSGYAEGVLDLGHPFYLQRKLLERLNCKNVNLLEGIQKGHISLLECSTFEQEARHIAELLERFSKEDKKTAFITQNALLRTLVEEELLKFNIRLQRQKAVCFSQTHLGRFLYLSAVLLFEKPAFQNVFSFLKHPLSGAEMHEISEMELLLRKSLFPSGERIPIIEDLLSRSQSNHKHHPAKWYGEQLQDFLGSYLEEDLCEVWGALEHLPVLSSVEFVSLFKELLAQLAPSLKILRAAQDDDRGSENANVNGEGLQNKAVNMNTERHPESTGGDLELTGYQPDPTGRHPEQREGSSTEEGLDDLKASNIHFWTPLEARLRVADVIILGDLNEDSWPKMTSNPWLSEGVKENLGLPTGVEYQGLSFLDFLQLSRSSEQCIITRSLLKDGKAQTPSRFLYARDGYIKETVSQNKRSLETLNLSYRRQVNTKPLEMYQSDVRLLIQNPYAFYIKKILRLVSIPEFQETISARLLGQMVHKMFELVVKNKPFENSGYDPVFDTLTSYQKTQFSELVKNFKHLAVGLQKEGWTLLSETEKKVSFGSVQVAARMDLVLQQENSIRIVDYKTSLPPSLKSVLEYNEPQLALEALCYGEGAESLEYWHTPLATGKIKEIKIKPEPEWMAQAKIFFETLFQNYIQEDYVFERTETVFERDEQHFMKIEF